MTGKEARDMSADQRSAELTDLRRKLHSLRTQAVTEKVEDNSQFRKIRRDIARLLGAQTQTAASGGGTAVAEKPAKAPAKKPVAKKPAPKKAAEKKN